MTTYAAGGYVAAPLTSAPYPAGPATPSMVGDQLDVLLGEHLMPLRVRSADADEPHLLAVDASGQPVVVEIVALLDEEAAIRALRHAGRAARMSTRDLAQAYSGGADRYASHLAAFRLTVPSTALLSTFVRGGARLLLVCSHISAGMEDVLEFLLQPGWQVDVLRAEVVTEPDGRRVVELSPVARSVVPQRIVDSPAWARGLDPDPFPAPFDPTPLYRSRAERPQPAPLLDQAPIDALPEWSSARAAARSDWPPEDSSAMAGWSSTADVREPAWSPLSRPAPLIVPPSFAVPLAQLDTDVPDPLLAAVAAALAGPAVLVWAPEGAAECFEALLHEDGIVELADGRQYGDVETAARAVSGLRGPLDAWQVWHVDSPSGPTLADLAAQSFPGQF